MAMVTKTVYGLVDPRDGRVRYVGSSKRPAIRYRSHLSGGDKCTGEWVAELKALGLRPDLRLLTDPVTDWARHESKAIRSYPDLLNRTSTVGGTTKFDPIPILAQYIAERRVDQGLSQSELARRSGLTQASVSNYEAGKRDPSLISMVKISQGLGDQNLAETFGGLDAAIETAKRAMRGE